ncbi:hypothetical protein R3W88_025662 [Solanum pinnatisectum]|uniref:Uncharacterized protein n=1 Tax=Solanum pinnatisectum TaxID=50273 RepID=A0AAV9M612_9SOLN|nr:hypothetical protein R3W88_025662 [Solanum pinnatisectum]
MKVYVGRPIVPPNFVKAMEAVGWLGNFIVSHLISTYLKLDTALYCTISFGLLTFFCWFMLLRPVASDLGIHYASSTLLMTMTIRDYGLNNAMTWASGILCVVLVVIRLVAEMVAVSVLQPPAIGPPAIEPSAGWIRMQLGRLTFLMVTLFPKNFYNILNLFSQKQNSGRHAVDMERKN